MVCVDEVSQVLHQEVHAALPARPGRLARQDYEYRRVGTANLFMLTAPFAGWRHVEVTARRTQRDFAQILKDLVDVHFPQAPRITLVCDNLNTHKPPSCTRALGPPRPGASPAVWSGSTPPSMPAGSTLRRSRSTCSNAKPWPGASPTLTRCVPKSRLGQNSAMHWAPLCNGALRPPTLASNCGHCILQSKKVATLGLKECLCGYIRKLCQIA